MTSFPYTDEYLNQIYKELETAKMLRDLTIEKGLALIDLIRIEKRCEDFKFSVSGTGARLPCDMPIGNIEALLDEFIAMATRRGLISKTGEVLP